MSIKDFIQNEVLLARLKNSPAQVLVVYDPAGRYREPCLALASERLRVIDASASSIESRQAAMAAFQAMGQPHPPLDGLLIYAPAAPPQTDEARRVDPFAVYGACGAVFPDSDGDEYLSLCLRAKADYKTEIYRIFKDNPDPSFAVIDAVGAGGGWPVLQATLKTESVHNLLFALLAPSEAQRAALEGQTAWAAEARALLESALDLALMTRLPAWGPIADELWRFVLFSEFALDLPDEPPPQLANVPRARPEARGLVEDVCDRLRNDRRSQAIYIERAEGIEQELKLEALCRGRADLGQRDTFPFEERAGLGQAVEALRRGNVDRLRALLGRHHDSVWVGRGENQAQWLLLQAAANLVQACDDAEGQWPAQGSDQTTLIDAYTGSLRQVDRLQREFEQAVGDMCGMEEPVSAVIEQARATYQRFANRLQAAFVYGLERSGWPPAGRLANSDVFDRKVAPHLQESGRRVGLILIDALRYELGVELHKLLEAYGQVELHTACAVLPSITPVGMAALLPGAGPALRLVRRQDKLLPALGDQVLANVAQRMEVLRKRYGQRFAELSLADFVRGPGQAAATVEILVLRSNEMDNDFESNPEAAAGLIGRTFQQVGAACRKLRELGFQTVVIATDHGFYLNPAGAPGEVCSRPAGNWLNCHERLLVGDGVGDGANFVLPAERLGMRGDFNQAAGPRAMVAYRAGQRYFHGGASLQEAVLPVIELRLQTAQAGPGQGLAAQRPAVRLAYKRGAKRITTRLPVVEVTVEPGDLFSLGARQDILVEAHDASGRVVGEARPGGAVNPVTHSLSLGPGESTQVTLRMLLTFEGAFRVKALDPSTLMALGDDLELETDYVV